MTLIKQTRCSTCDFEHPYKDGKLPVRRTKKDGTSALYKQVLDNVTDGVPDDQPSTAAPVRPARPEAPRPVPVLPETPAIETPVAAAPTPLTSTPTARRPPTCPGGADARAGGADAGPSGGCRRRPPPPAPLAAAPASQSDESRDDGNEGIVHRRLIRATLPQGRGRRAGSASDPGVHRARGSERPRQVPPLPTAGRRLRQREWERARGGNGNAMPRFGHGGQPSPFGAQGRGHGKGGGPNRGGGQPGNRANQQQRRGNKGR